MKILLVVVILLSIARRLSQASEYMLEQIGKDFDPEITTVFLAVCRREGW